MHLHELMAKVTKVDLEYQSEHGRRAGNEKLAELVGISQEKLAMLSKVCLCSAAPPRVSPLRVISGAQSY